MEMLLTVEQTAQRLQMHPVSVRRLLQRGQMRGIKRGRVWRVPESALTEPEKTGETAMRTPVSVSPIVVSPLAQALAMVEAMDVNSSKRTQQPTNATIAISDAAALLRESRAERTSHLENAFTKSTQVRGTHAKGESA